MSNEDYLNIVIIYVADDGQPCIWQHLARTPGDAIAKFEKESYTQCVQSFVVYSFYKNSAPGLTFEGRYNFAPARRSWERA